MEDAHSTLRLGMELALEPAAAFDRMVEDAAAALRRQGLAFEPGPEGRLTEGGFEVGRVLAWEPPRRILLEWRAASWDLDDVTEVEIRFEPIEAGTRVTLEHRGWGGAIGEVEEVAGWFASELLAPFLRRTAPEALGDWLTDRAARRPWGRRSRSIYRDPLYHYPNFRVILEELTLEPGDRLLEVGCGGGAMLGDALASGCRAVGLDHSHEMVRVARETNRDAVEEGRLRLVEGSAERLPFREGAFTRVAMTGILGFLPDPVRALAEIRRVLAPGGRLVAMGADPELRGTPGAPEPMASQLRFYEAEDLERLGREAGFGSARAILRDLEPHAREVGVPEEHLPLFGSHEARFLIAGVG